MEDYGGLWMIMVGGAKRILRIPSNDSRLTDPMGPWGPSWFNGWSSVRKTAELKFRTPDGASVGMKLNGIEYKGHKAGD